MKIIVFDSGPLINLAMNGLLYILPELKKQLKGAFYITTAVKKEIIDRPTGIPRFELGALQLSELVTSGVIEVADATVDQKKLAEETNALMDVANHFVHVNGTWVPLVSAGEISCLALCNQLRQRGDEVIIAIDERTTRLLAESPRDVAQLMSERLHQRVTLAAEASVFSSYKFIRSAELVYVAYVHGLLHPAGKKTLEAALYACKYKGCAITFEEIQQLKKLA